MIDKRVYCKHEGQGVYAEYFQEVSKKQCEEYCGQLEKDGFVLHEEHWLGENTFYTYANEKDINFVSYYPNVQEMHVVSEPNSNWLQYSDEAGEDKVSTLLNHMFDAVLFPRHTLFVPAENSAYPLNTAEINDYLIGRTKAYYTWSYGDKTGATSDNKHGSVKLKLGTEVIATVYKPWDKDDIINSTLDEY